MSSSLVMGWGGWGRPGRAPGKSRWLPGGAAEAHREVLANRVLDGEEEQRLGGGRGDKAPALRAVNKCSESGGVRFHHG